VKIVQPEGWPRPRGYANGIVARGKVVFVAGQVGWDADGHIRPDFPAQVRQTLENIVTVLAAAGARPTDITRMTWYVTDKREYLAAQKAIGAAYRVVIGNHYPAMSVVEVSGLIEDGARVEIEATAVISE
jgi:enamine deaminase RidA (YjgF/YER057c/UK114 family)